MPRAASLVIRIHKVEMHKASLNEEQRCILASRHGYLHGKYPMHHSYKCAQTVRLADLLDEAKDRCKSTIKARREERKEPISAQELERSAAIMGYAAVKYMDLKNNRKTDYK